MPAILISRLLLDMRGKYVKLIERNLITRVRKLISRVFKPSPRKAQR